VEDEVAEASRFLRQTMRDDCISIVAASNHNDALVRWLRENAEGLFAPADDRLDGLVVEEGRIAGVILDTADGPCRIGVNRGLALSLAVEPQYWPDQPELAGLEVDVAVVGRQAGRFARVELIALQ
jgi:hypothetical protein